MTPVEARKMTGIIIVALILALVIYDIIVEVKFGTNTTISQVIFDTISHSPWMAFFWRRTVRPLDMEISYVAVQEMRIPGSRPRMAR